MCHLPTLPAPTTAQGSDGPATLGLSEVLLVQHPGLEEQLVVAHRGSSASSLVDVSMSVDESEPAISIDSCLYLVRSAHINTRGGHVEVRRIEPCCAPITDEALSAAQSRELAGAFKVLSDPVRLRLLSLVAAAPAGEVRAADLVAPLGRSQPTVSHHLSVLADAGLLQRDQRGREAWFRPVHERFAVLRTALGG